MPSTDSLAACQTASRPWSQTGLKASPPRLPNVELLVAHFEAIAEARSRRVTWQQIAKALAEGASSNEEGREVGWTSLKNLYHAERYTRGERGKRRCEKATAGSPC